MAKDAVLRVFDTSGRLLSVFTNLQTGDSCTWQTGDATSGIYYYQFTSDGKAVNGKILLNR
jgi:hypothetical protein